MGDWAIRVENLGKRYQIGRAKVPYRRFSEAVAQFMTAPLRRRRSAGSSEVPPDYIWALRGVSFVVQRGEVVGLIGRNGTGKSTLLKLISRVTRPSEGRAEVRGRVGSLLEVGTGFHPELSGRENVYLNGTILGMKRREIDRRFDEIVAFAEVERFIDTPVKHYSSGMYLRLAFGVAAHLEPEVLLVDEVLAVGDMAFQKKCLGKMQHVAKQEGRTVLFVSHNMGAIRALCQRGILLDAGRSVCDGDIREVVESYLKTAAPLAMGVIPDTAARDGTGEARFRGIRLSNLAGEQISQVYLGQPFRLTFTLEAARPIQGVVLEAGLSSLDGTRFATAISVDGGQPALDLPAGRCQVSADVSLFLLPGPYSVDVLVHRWPWGILDGLQRVLDFEVVNAAEAGDDRYRWVPSGFVRPTTRWHSPVPEQAASSIASAIPFPSRGPGRG
jgi:lipopolysaccharide transport system ATP-binding protein